MYGSKILYNMRYLFVILVLIFSGISLAQSNTEVPATNLNTNSYSNSSGESILDTLMIKETEEIQQEKSVKKSKTVDKSYKDSAPQSVKNEDANKKVTTQAASSSFVYTKQQAATQRTQRTPSAAQQVQMDNVVKSLEESAPESFEYHYFKYVAGNYNVELIEHLKKAETLRPANSDVQIQLAAYYLILNDSKNALVYLDKLVASTRINKELIDYAEDLLLSATDNGTLITHGFDDTYATAYVQLSKKIRTDVKLLSLDFIQSEKYKTNLKAQGFILPDKKVVDVSYFQDFCTKNSLKNISISMTTPKEYLTAIQQNLFVVGLIFEYHTDLTFNNFYRNEYLWNEVLTKKLINQASNEKAKQLSANYLPMLLHLRKVYTQKNEMAKVKLVDKDLDSVSVQCKKYDQVQKLKASY